MKFGSVRVCNLTGGVSSHRFEAKNIGTAWQIVDDEVSKHEEFVVFPITKDTLAALFDLIPRSQTTNEHREIIIESLKDYRGWWDCSCEFWADKIKAIDSAIQFIVGDGDDNKNRNRHNGRSLI